MKHLILDFEIDGIIDSYKYYTPFNHIHD